MTSLIGPNGAGKTTAFNVHHRLSRPTSGRIACGRPLTSGCGPAGSPRSGWCAPSRRPACFPPSPCMENVLIGLHLRGQAGLAAALLAGGGCAEEDARCARRARRASTSWGSGPAGRGGERPLLRRAAAGGAGGGLARAPAAAAAGRARLGHDAGERGRRRRADPQDPRDRRHRVAGGARHAHGDGHLGSRPRPQPRSRSSPRPARRRAAGPRGDPRLPGHGPCCRLESVTRGTGGWGRCAAATGGARGDLVCLLGANGAGKTTTLRTISGLLRPSAGRIVFEGRHPRAGSRRRSSGCGIAHCPEGRRVFPHLTVQENLAMGAYVRRDAAAVGADLERVLRTFPRPGRAPAPAGGHAVGRRAADAGDRARADGAAPPYHVRRAVAGAGAHGDGDDVPRSSQRSRRTGPRCSWWSRTPTWRSAWPTRAT